MTCDSKINLFIEISQRYRFLDQIINLFVIFIGQTSCFVAEENNELTSKSQCILVIQRLDYTKRYVYSEPTKFVTFKLSYLTEGTIMAVIVW